jgi:hypothetical protein
MVRGLGRSVIFLLIDKKLPAASDTDRQLSEELRAEFMALPVEELDGLPPSAASWVNNNNTLRQLVLNADPRGFLRWDVIGRTMFVKSPKWIPKELTYLKQRDDWQLRLRSALEESTVGHPSPYWRYPRSSGNLIHTAYSLINFEGATGIAIENLDTVVEFGGGYGSMCRLIHNLGFIGKYVIFDLPAFGALQRYYLRSLGLNVLAGDSVKSGTSGIACVQDLETLAALTPSAENRGNAALVATWSLSEAPIELRDNVLSLVSGFGAYLIASQSHYREVDNVEYFDRWRATEVSVAWHQWQIDHLGTNFYLMGARSSP